MKINTLVLGSGGREHAITWKISQSPLCGEIYCLPGNPGTASCAVNLPGKVTDFEAIKQQVLEHDIELVVVGPEDPLVNGLRDFFQADDALSNVKFVGPNKLGATMEGSKEFAKAFMYRNNIPTAAYKSFTSETLADAQEFLKTLHPPFVLKADGLAAGKGVLIIDDYDEAVSSLREMFSGKFGNAGATVVIEEFLSGIELSVFVLTDGKNYMVLPEAKDYKRIGEGDTGLNTGGMGAVSPVPFANSEFMKKVEDRIIKPTIDGFDKEGFDYKGFVFIGLMNCDGEPYVIEYNVRMGDPETEAVMTRIDSDLLSHLYAAADGTLNSEQIVISDKAAVTVVTVSGGYPEAYKKAYPISGLENIKDAMCFHSGTASDGETVVTMGGRVFALTALGKDIITAKDKAYSQVSKILYKDIYFRKDITKDLEKYLFA